MEWITTNMLYPIFLILSVIAVVFTINESIKKRKLNNDNENTDKKIPEKQEDSQENEKSVSDVLPENQEGQTNKLEDTIIKSKTEQDGIYNNLISKKLTYDGVFYKETHSQSQRITDYIILSEEFCNIGNYLNASKLAEECQNTAGSIYNLLRWEKRRAQNYFKKIKKNSPNLLKSEKEFETLSTEFRSIGNYRDASILANECEDMVEKIQKRIRLLS